MVPTRANRTFPQAERAEQLGACPRGICRKTAADRPSTGKLHSRHRHTDQYCRDDPPGSPTNQPGPPKGTTHIRGGRGIDPPLPRVRGRDQSASRALSVEPRRADRCWVSRVCSVVKKASRRVGGPHTKVGWGGGTGTFRCRTSISLPLVYEPSPQNIRSNNQSRTDIASTIGVGQTARELRGTGFEPADLYRTAPSTLRRWPGLATHARGCRQ